MHQSTERDPGLVRCHRQGRVGWQGAAVGVETGGNIGLGLARRRHHREEEGLGCSGWAGSETGEASLGPVAHRAVDPPFFCIQLGKQCQLEIRKAEHSPSSIVDNGTRIVRPPSIEGYLDFIRPINQSKQPVYLSTHEGLLFVLAPGHAHPPSPPGANLTAGEMKECEVRRGALQIEEAYGVCDLRNVVAVRRAFQMVPTFVEHAPSGQSKARTRGVEEWANVWLAEEGLSSGGVRIAESEDEDEGGDEGLAKVVDKGRLKVRRSFELLLIGGQVFRFEASIHRFPHHKYVP
jgi:hypothetical protein